MSTTTARKTLPRRRVAIGPRRPQYLHEVELDRMMMIVTALAAEVSALRDRLDTHEALAVRDIAPTHAAVEAYVVDESDAARRETNRMAAIKRVYRILTEELDAMNQSDDATRPATWTMPDEWDKT